MEVVVWPHISRPCNTSRHQMQCTSGVKVLLQVTRRTLSHRLYACFRLLDLLFGQLIRAAEIVWGIACPFHPDGCRGREDQFGDSLPLPPAGRQQGTYLLWWMRWVARRGCSRRTCRPASVRCTWWTRCVCGGGEHKRWVGWLKCGCSRRMCRPASVQYMWWTRYGVGAEVCVEGV